MGKKYIIEMEDMMFHKTGESGAETFLWRVKGFNSLVFDRAGIGKLTPYTEPDLEQIRKEAYEKGYEDGFVAGHLKAEKSGQSFYEDGYKRGLSDAWEAARKIHRMLDGDIIDLFPDCYASVCTAAQPILKYDASEAIAKIKEYEDGKQEYCVGDEFENGAGQKFVVLKMDGKEIDRYIDGDGKTYVMKEKYRVMRKTGRSFPEIAAVLEKMRGDQE